MSSQWLIGHVDRDRAGDRAQHEADGDRQHVDDDDVLERAGIQREQRDVAERDERERRAEQRTPPPSAPAAEQRRRAERQPRATRRPTRSADAA